MAYYCKMQHHTIDAAMHKYRPGPSLAQTQRALHRLNVYKALNEEACNRSSTLEHILSDDYTAKLPSQVAARTLKVHQVPHNSTTPDDFLHHDKFKPELQPDNVSPVSRRVCLNIGLANGHDADLQTAFQCSLSASSDQVNDLPTDSLKACGTTRSIQCSSPSADDVGDSNSKEIEDHDDPQDELLRPSVGSSIPQDKRQSSPSCVEHETSTKAEFQQLIEDNERISNASMSDSNQAAVVYKDSVADASMVTSVSSVDSPRPDVAYNKGKERTIRSLPYMSPTHIMRSPYLGWPTEPGSSEPGHDLMHRPNHQRYPVLEFDSEEPLESPPELPTKAHLTAVAQLTPEECMHLLNEFLQQNAVRLERYCTMQQHYPNRSGSKNDPNAIHAIFNAIWNNQDELKLLTDAILWMDALLHPFRAEILAEDLAGLKPRLQNIVHRLQAIQIPSRSNRGTPISKVSDEDSEIIDLYTKQVATVQASNSRRKYLLEHVRIDPTTIENLLQMAETIKHRHDVSREHDQEDKLVDALRRIYSAVVCSIPVGLPEAARIAQPNQADRKQYGFGPFESYKLPGRSELFDHDSVAKTRISSQGCTGIQLSEEQSPLSSGYWRDMRDGMMQAIAAQREDEIGQSKLRKNPDSMNRDLGAVYTSIYERGMTNYAVDAAQRIKQEEIEESSKRTSFDMESTADAITHRDTIASMEPPGIVSEQNASGEDDRPKSLQHSPLLSDCTDDSDTSLQLVMGSQVDQVTVRRGFFCSLVNKPGGCLDRSSCGYSSHENEGKICQSEANCTFGMNCAFIHRSHTSNIPATHGTIHRNSLSKYGARLTRDLKPILKEVLADPQAYSACTFVNKPKGCAPRNGQPCTFNHTLEGVICEDYQHGTCRLEYIKCPLRHVYYNALTAELVTTTGQGSGSAHTHLETRGGYVQSTDSHISNHGYDIDGAEQLFVGPRDNKRKRAGHHDPSQISGVDGANAAERTNGYEDDDEFDDDEIYEESSPRENRDPQPRRGGRWKRQRGNRSGSWERARQ